MAPDELLRGLPGYPFTAWVLVALVILAGVAKSWQNRPQKQRTTNAKFGQRLQAVEQLQALEVVRRLQVEDELRALGVRLPFWPGDPVPDQSPAPQIRSENMTRPPAPRPPAEQLDDDDLDGWPPHDDEPMTVARVAVPPIPAYPRHRRSTT